MSGKYALIIGNTEYIDPGLAQLTAPGKDAEDFARVLKDKEIGAFDDVKVIVNELSASVIEAIDEFFDQKKPDDMLVLYFSGHGIRDEIGSLYLAFKNTIRSRLRSTAIKSDYIREAMDQSRSKRQVLILDCCNSGAFPQGTKAELGGVMGMTRAFQGYGRFVLTASDATQFAWEGDKVIGETDNSLFTHFLVKGLNGDADSDGDGRITVDELYDYAYDQISRVTPKQTPTKSSSKVEGEIVLRQATRIENIKPMPLPAELMDEVGDTRPYVREAAVQKLEKILKGRNIGLARSAREALEKIVADDNTTRHVAQAAIQALESVRPAKQLADQEREDELLAAEKLKLERKSKEGIEQLAKKKIENEQAAQAKASRNVVNRVVTKESKTAKFSLLTIGIVGIGVITFAIFGFAIIIFLPSILPHATTTSPATQLLVAESLATQTRSIQHPTIQPQATNLSPTKIVPKGYGFQACESACNGQNFSVMFPGGIKKIYVQFNYENIPSGSSYIRTWDLEDKEWIRYSCNWDGPESGTEILKFTEPDGLHSGVWTLTVRVNNNIILQEQLTIAGDWTYWKPAGIINACHGTN